MPGRYISYKPSSRQFSFSALHCSCTTTQLPCLSTLNCAGHAPSSGPLPKVLTTTPTPAGCCSSIPKFSLTAPVPVFAGIGRAQSPSRAVHADTENEYRASRWCAARFVLTIAHQRQPAAPKLTPHQHTRRRSSDPSSLCLIDGDLIPPDEGLAGFLFSSCR